MKKIEIAGRIDSKFTDLEKNHQNKPIQLMLPW